MGSYFGHGIEATFFLFVGVWWMINSYYDHIKATRSGGQYVTRCSYPWPGKKKIPFEAIVKLSFAVIGMIVEVAGAHFSFINDDNEFYHLAPMQHISIYFLFILYGGSDLLCRLGAPLPNGIDWICGGMSFAWYGVCFTYHVLGHSEMSMEYMVHILPTYTMHLIAIACAIEVFKPSIFMLQLARVFGLLVLGTWFWHVAGMLYLPYPFPGSINNPHYDRDVMTNVHFVVAAFGFHLSLNLFAMIVTYLVMAGIIKMTDKGVKKHNYTHIQLGDEDLHTACLAEEDEGDL